MAANNPVLLQSRSMVLGALPDADTTLDSLEVELELDDRVVLYTDGVQEIVREASALPAEKDEARHS